MFYPTVLCICFFLIKLYISTYAQEVCLFGSAPSCHFPCRCGNDSIEEICDPKTGACPSGSCGYSGDTQWSGPGCQYGDIAYGKKVYLANHMNESGIYFGADNFTAGAQNDTCEDEPQGEIKRSWFIDLEDNYSVESLFIKLYQFSFFFYLCNHGHIIISTFDEIGNAENCGYFYLDYLQHYGYDYSSCYGTTRFIELDLDYWFCYFDGYYIPLCDLSIIGYPVVNINCSNCQQDPRTGSCGNGLWCEQCDSGWLPPDCQMPCQTGYYGINCLQRCKHHCSDIPCNATTGEMPEEALCENCELWYAQPQDFCTNYINMFEPYTNSITEVYVQMETVTVKVMYDKRVPLKLAEYYYYHLEYSSDNFTTFTTVYSVGHILDSPSDHFSAHFSFPKSHEPYWIRSRLFRKHNGFEETGSDPTTITIPRGCQFSVQSDKCLTLSFNCDCKIDHQYDNTVMYKESRNDHWTSTSCEPMIILQHGGTYDVFLKIVKYSNGILVTLESDTKVINVDNCETSQTNIILVVFLVIFVITTTILLVLLCWKGKYYSCLQRLCKKEKKPEEIGPVQTYENMAYSPGSNKLSTITTANAGSTPSDPANDYEMSNPVSEKNVDVEVIGQKVYDYASHTREQKEMSVYSQLSRSDSKEDLPNVYLQLSER